MHTHKVYMGYDAREDEAFKVAQWSIQRRSISGLVKPIRLQDEKVSQLLSRPVEMKDGRMWCPISQAPMSTEFAISRFLVPWLHWPAKGWALFVDCDIVCLTDIAGLFELADPKYAMMCVKHDHKPTEGVPWALKMDGQVQTSYARKNWSSLLLFNTDHPANRRLTIEDVNTWPGRDLHALRWLQDDEIGELPLEWNYLVGASDPAKASEAKLLHYTLGTPNLPGYENCPFADVWRKELAEKNSLSR